MTDAPQAKPDGHRKTPLLKPVSPVLERIATAHRDRRIKPAIHPTPTFWTIPRECLHSEITGCEHDLAVSVAG